MSRPTAPLCLNPGIPHIVNRFGRLAMPDRDLEDLVADDETDCYHVAIRASVQGFQVAGDSFVPPPESHARPSG